MDRHRWEKIVSMLTILMVATLATGCCCCREKKTKAQIAKDKAAASAKQEAKKVELAELAETKKRCGDAFGSTGWEDTCRDLVRARLFQPSSADFSFLMSVARDSDKVKCRQIYSSTVESKNAFGAVIEHRFLCSFNSKTNKVTLDSIRMN